LGMGWLMILRFRLRSVTVFCAQRGFEIAGAPPKGCATGRRKNF
jgi:hypothetical protein